MTSFSRLSRALLLAVTLTVAVQSPARAAGGFADMVRYVFVPMRDSTAITVIDSRDDTVAGAVEVGLVPSQIEISGDWARLAAVDGVSSRLAMIDLTSEAGPRMVPLPFVPDRLTISGDGRTLAALALGTGEAAFIDVFDARLRGTASGLGPLTDILLNRDGTLLYAATRGREGLGIVDVAAGRMVAEIPPQHAGMGEIASLSRAPSGRVAYLKPAKAAAIAVADFGEARTAAIEAGEGVDKAYTNATGITLVLPDNHDRSVGFVAASTLKRKATLKGAGGMSAVYSGWFDTVTFIPSTVERKVLVFDQQGLERGDDIVLDGVPGRGTVTPDGRKLYLPLMDADALVVVDAEYRRLGGRIALPGRPVFAVMGRTFGICH